MGVKQLVVALLLPAFLIFSAGIAAEGASGSRVVAYLEVMQDGSLIVEAQGGWDNPDSCGHPYRFIVPSTNPFLDRYYAAILAGYTSGSTIWAWFSGCQTMGWGEQYPIAKNAAIRAK
jgi:hypothetical protein